MELPRNIEIGIYYPEVECLCLILVCMNCVRFKSFLEDMNNVNDQIFFDTHSIIIS
jgi:hypothetical protein